MGLFGGGGDDEIRYEYDEEYVAQVVESAEDDTVTAEVLTRTDSKRLFSGSGYLHDQSLLAHLDAAEQPHYVFHNEESGVITTSDGSRLEPGANYRAVAAFTDSRLFVVVGQDSGDETLSASYDEITGFDVKSGNSRFVVETDDEGYIFDVADPVEERRLLDIIEFLIFHTDIETWDFPENWHSGIQRRRAQRLSSRAEGAFDIDKLEGILEPLGDDEQPHYLIPASSVTVDHLENAFKPIDRVVVTDRRLLINGEETTYRFEDFEADDEAEFETAIPYGALDWIEGRSKDGESGALVVRQTWGPVCRVHVPASAAEESDSGVEEFESGVEGPESGVEGPSSGVADIVNAIRYVQRQILTSRIDYDDTDPLERIEQLGKLNRAGYIDDDAFEAEKRSLLDK
ncbi:PH domain-containing protein [Halorussus ruber]|uniref:PH domain-containing protein n=1 Tax=Halorussus ruber TaxID=1126238 RepID=UPI001092140A|nr:PH domain-containing protein [Halorussus ruber]